MTAPSPGGRERSDSVASSVFEQHDESFVRSTRRTLDNCRVSVVDVGILVALLGLCLLGQLSPTPITFAGWSTIFMIGVAVLLMARHGAPPDVTLLACTGLLRVGGVISSSEAWQGFGSPDIISIGVLFAVAKGLQEAGTMELVLRAALGSPRSVPVAVVRVMAPLVVLSAFMNDIFCVIVLIPVVETWAARIDVHPRRLMLPVAFGALLGGMCTLLGTSTNLVLNDLIKKDYKDDAAALAPLELFSCSVVAVPVAAIGTLYMAFAMRSLLPPKDGDAVGRGGKLAAPLLDDDAPAPREFPYVVEVEVDDAAAGGGLVGEPLEQTSLVRTPGAAVLKLRPWSGEPVPSVLRRKFSLRRSSSASNASAAEEREECKDEEAGELSKNRRLAAGDVLVVACDGDGLAALRRVRGVRLAPTTGDAARLGRATPTAPPAAARGRARAGVPLVGAGTDDDGDAALVASREYGAALVAARAGDAALRPGSLALLEARPEILAARAADFSLARVVPDSAPPRASRSYDSFRCWLALAVMLAMIAAFSFNELTLLEASLLATGLLVFTQCLTIEQAFAAIKGRDLVAIVAAYGVGAALGNTGVASTLAHRICDLGQRLGASGLLALVYLVIALLGSIMSNQAVVILLYPILKEVAGTQDLVSMKQLVNVLVIGSSSSFLTPFSYQTNLLVQHYYEFSDFLRVGSGLTLLLTVATSVLVVTLVD
ncbi:potassium ion transporter [Aureococcus anophagefferens]|uniref:Potassium ion transporter n=1 Tax=Aureococcus anophagefferens TaxID=44056 RepID=A0ABR1FSS6_AURAN